MAGEAKTMKETNTLNVYKGPESIKDYFDPDTAPPLPLVEVPSCLNPYHVDGVRIFAKMMSMHPANNVKCMPALNLLEKSVKPDVTKTIVEYSSGSTVLSMSLVGRAIYGLDDIRAFLSNKTSIAKIRLMQLFGINITLFGGPSQPEPLDERGGIRAAQRLGNETIDSLNPNQYENENNWKSHVRWTGPQILRQLPEINLICAGMGTSGTMTGLGTYFKGAKPEVFRLGVCTAAGDRVPGPRSYALLGPVTFPWKSSVDHVEEVGSYESYRLSLELCRQGLVCGPSSGFNLKGLYQYIDKQKTEGNLSNLAGPDGLINCVFLCCDLPYQYVNEYFDKLDDSCFPPVKNEELLNVDLYRYDEKWEWEASKALQGYFHVNEEQMDVLMHRTQEPCTCEIPKLSAALHPRDNTAILDLRQPADFDQGKLPGSVNIPLAQPGTASPFSDPSLLGRLWTGLDKEFSSPSGELTGLQGKDTLIVCYDGDSARVAASVMRAKGYEANSLRAGLDGLVTMLSTPLSCSKNEPEQQASWLQLCEAQRPPAVSVEASASNPSSELGNVHQAAVIDYLCLRDKYASVVGSMGKNQGGNNGAIWVGNDGPTTFTFTNRADQSSPATIIVVIWLQTDGQSSFVNVRRPYITWSLPNIGDSVTISMAQGISGGFAALNHRITILKDGQVFNTWGEWSTGPYATVDVSREPNMGGNHMEIQTSGGCHANMDRCVFKCKNGNRCGSSGDYYLQNCEAGSQAGNPHIGYDPWGNPTGGCGGFENGGSVTVSLQN